MNLLYLSYWNLNDPLTDSTVFPSLAALVKIPDVESIVFVNIERSSLIQTDHPHLSSIIYKPFLSERNGGLMLEKFRDYYFGSAHVSKLISEYKIDLVISRGAPAGSIAYLATRKNRIPFLVESFEPHAQYMLESGIWSALDPRYLLQRFFEERQKRNAFGLLPVAENYRKALIQEGIPPEKIFTVPCTVDPEKFSYSAEARREIRERLEINSDDLVGVYAGRYGGLYLEREAIQLYKTAFSVIPNFRLIILTPEIHQEWLRKSIDDARLPSEKIHIESVPHAEVVKYLSAADFAFATYKPGESKAFLSPVKVAEYWANGLPVVITDGIGDESSIVARNPDAGLRFDPHSADFKPLFKKVQQLLPQPRDGRNILRELVDRYRSRAVIENGYVYFLNRLSHELNQP